MTPFCSVALIRRDGEIVFRRPRKERPSIATQARKAAARHWNKALSPGDQLVKLVVLRERDGLIEIAERAPSTTVWADYTASAQEASKSPHLAACLGEIGVTGDFAPPPVPDTLVINGFVYRRDL